MASSRRSFLSGFLTGLAVGLSLALAVAVWIGFSNPFVDPPTSPSASSEGQTSPKVAPDYDFYKSLPSDKTPSLPQETPIAPPDTTYYLQAGAFLNAEDAEEMKARLALLGYEAGIQLMADAEAIRLHKVRIGPFKGMDELNKTRARLTQNGIDTLLIKIAPKNPTKENP
jgi:cell division protein FtsN